MRAWLGEKLAFDGKIVTITILSTLLLTLHYYRRLTPNPYLDKFLLFFLIPALVIHFFFREDIRGYGFTLGNWRLGIKLVLLGSLLVVPVLYLLGRYSPAMIAFYSPMVQGLPWNGFLELFSWEFLFRGFILFGYSRKFGPNAIWLQAVPFALAHLGKPEIETWTTLFGGFAFGWVAYQTRSFLWALLLHWFVFTFTILVSAGKI